ncbi:uncharacterized protein L969DRAFT_85347 [Mixia osmundae IAM 14324]|uniref:Uncharacterized protein n=1 Tax=Mixia osmundae (strain CBS 9802 / IAM 14324 / JCM 22182 / KY 12970) TaxID=764103 RepID=G7DYI8_MIXOS|nr:uncharacterized protein L969DRAFT_85347 [Mixia osmundae IAM 14324]KEI41549.1 hypothetical protein L969DRAFT_85347 [Mixia osmundae IAM 14324]GAA95648.1 hypothetical protein E5Q_02304 [Mixia osmundae IAM 14324]
MSAATRKAKAGAQAKAKAKLKAQHLEAQTADDSPDEELLFGESERINLLGALATLVLPDFKDADPDRRVPFMFDADEFVRFKERYHIDDLPCSHVRAHFDARVAVCSKLLLFIHLGVMRQAEIEYQHDRGHRAISLRDIASTIIRQAGLLVEARITLYANKYQESLYQREQIFIVSLTVVVCKCCNSGPAILGAMTVRAFRDAQIVKRADIIALGQSDLAINTCGPEEFAVEHSLETHGKQLVVAIIAEVEDQAGRVPFLRTRRISRHRHPAMANDGLNV